MAISPNAAMDQELEHLRWLNAKDQEALCRAECLAALREDCKLVNAVQTTVNAYLLASEYCRAASEGDPEWFTLDVQDSHHQRVALLNEVLLQMTSEPMPAPKDSSLVDEVKGRWISGYAKTAEATSRAAAGISENPSVQAFEASIEAVATSAITAIGTFSNRIATEWPPQGAAALFEEHDLWQGQPLGFVPGQLQDRAARNWSEAGAAQPPLPGSGLAASSRASASAAGPVSPSSTVRRPTVNLLDGEPDEVTIFEAAPRAEELETNMLGLGSAGQHEAILESVVIGEAEGPPPTQSKASSNLLD